MPGSGRKLTNVDLQRLERAEEIAEELRAATREARECLADFRQLRRDWEDVRREWGKVVKDRFAEEFKPAIDSSFATLLRGMELTESAIFRRFDTFAAILLGEDGEREPLADVLKRHRPTSKQREQIEFWRAQKKDDHDDSI